ncbi:MAG: 5'-nucleotidase C-terminal domain-containing protein [Coriobacteriia bacterium]|nr:5'-nucleotidase C-terminal domain-containing protein [Coriobacteriia bacterium]
MADERYRELTLLHSNDLHGDFLAQDVDKKLLGGISRLSGYVTETRTNNPNTLYCIAGDMLQGSLIDTEFKGISTIEIMNMLNPDIVSLGNHELDYGLGHLLFLERCAKFTIVNANMFIKNPHTRLFKPHKIIKKNGMNILFIGIITEEVLSSIKQDNLLSGFVDVEDAAREVGHICNAYRSVDIDFTILLTHIGFEEDKRLAAMLDPEWGVDVIIGGHSHTILEEPALVNNILIAQAGVGTNQIGRFDIVVDTDNNDVHSYTWQLIPIDEEHCPRDITLEETIAQYKQRTDEKYERVLCRFRKQLTHPDRYQETELGNLLSDALKDSLGIDLMILGSGSIRKERVHRLFTFGGFMELMPYDDRVVMLKVNGAQLRHMIAHMLRDSNLDGSHGEFYQFSKGLQAFYNRATQSFERFELNGEPLDDDDVISIGLQEYHFKNFQEFFNLPLEELVEGKGTTLTTSLQDVLIEFFSVAHQLNAKVEGRLCWC